MESDIWQAYQSGIKSGVQAAYERKRRDGPVPNQEAAYRMVLSAFDTVATTLGTKPRRRFPKANRRTDEDTLEERVNTAQRMVCEVDVYLERQARAGLENHEEAPRYDHTDTNHPLNLMLTAASALMHLRPIGRYLGVHTHEDVVEGTKLHATASDIVRARIRSKS